MTATTTAGTLSNLVLRALVAALAHVRSDAPAALLAEVGVDPKVLEDGEGRLPAPVVFRALERAPVIAGDDCFCLKAGQWIPTGAMDVVDFAMRSSSTIGEALERACRYYALFDDASELTIERSDDVARLYGKRVALPSPRAATELLFGLLISRGEALAERRWPMREVAFHRSAPRDPQGHARFFDAPVHFDRPRNEMVFDASWLDVPCKTHDPALAGFFDRHASALLARLSRPATFLDEVKRAIAEGMRGSDPKLETTAKRLGLGARTLQRRLDQEGTTHKDVVDDVRRTLARELLADPTIAIAEVAYLLGFFDTSTFYRAFKRWNDGKTPVEVRRELKG